MICTTCDAVLTRNARLIVRLRQFAAAIHRYENHKGHDWTRCQDASCVAALITIEQPNAGSWDHQQRTPNGQHFAPIFKDDVVGT